MIGCLGCVCACTVLIEHGGGDGLRRIKLFITCKVCACELELGTRGGDGGAGHVRLLLHIARINRHEYIACVDACPCVYVAR